MAKETEIKGLFGTFVFIGTPIVNTDKYYATGTSTGGFNHHRVQFGLKTKENNMIFLEVSGGYSSNKDNKINTFTANGDKLEVNWNDRKNESILKQIADMRKFKLGLNSSDERESSTYLTAYDFVDALKGGLPNDKRVVVVGNFKVDRYQNSVTGQYQTAIKYNPQKIRLAKEDEIDKAELTLSFVFDKDSWDESRLKDEMKVDVLGYTTVYDKTLTPARNIFIPLNLVLDFNHVFANATVALSNEQKVALIGMYKKYFTAKAKQYFETQWKCEVFRGVETKEITMNDLAPDQKVLVEMGLVSFETIAREMRNRVAGDRVNEIKLIRPTMKYVNEKTNLPEANLLTDYTEESFVIPSVEEETLEIDKLIDTKDGDVDLINRLFGNN